MGNIVKSASNVYPKKECYAVGAKPKLGRGSKRKKQLQQQGQSSKAVESYMHPPLNIWTDFEIVNVLFIFSLKSSLQANVFGSLHSPKKEWTENPWLSKMCKMEDKNLEYIFLSLLKKCVSIVVVS